MRCWFPRWMLHLFTWATGKTPVRGTHQFPGNNSCYDRLTTVPVYLNSVRISLWQGQHGSQTFKGKGCYYQFFYVITYFLCLNIQVKLVLSCLNKPEAKLSLPQPCFKLFRCQTKSFLIFHPAVNPTGTCLGPPRVKVWPQDSFSCKPPPSDLGATGGPESF